MCCEQWFLELLFANLLRASKAQNGSKWVHWPSNIKQYETQKTCYSEWFLQFLMVFTCSIDSVRQNKHIKDSPYPFIQLNDEHQARSRTYAAEPPSNRSVMIRWFVLQCPHSATQNSWAHQHRSWILLPRFVSRKCQRCSAQGLTMQTWPWRLRSEPKHDLKAGRIITMGGSS